MEGHLGHVAIWRLALSVYWLSINFVFDLSSVSDPDKRLQALWVVCDKLPKNNKTNLRLVVYTHTSEVKSVMF